MNPYKLWRLAAPVAVAAAFLVPTAPAQAACTPTVTPGSVVVGKTSKTVTWAVTGCDVADWVLTSTDGGPLVIAVPDGAKQTLLVGKDLSNARAGSHTLSLEAWDGSDTLVTDSTRTVKFLRRTYFSAFNAGPEPVKKGKSMKIAGDLKRVDWDKNAYAGYKNHKVVIQRKLPGGSYTDYKTVTTNSKGHFSTTVKASKTATWRVRSLPNSVSGEALSAGDGVVVK